MVDFTRFMGRGNLEPRFAPMPIATPAPTPVAPPPAPVAPLPNISGLPDLSNIDLSGLPGLPQMPLPAPVAAPAPVPPMEIAPGPLPELVTPPPLPPQLVPPPVPPMEIAPGPVPTPVMPPPLPPQPVPPPAVPPIDVAPPPSVPPIDVAPPPSVPPIDVAPPPAVPPFEIAPGPVPTPVTPPPLPPREPPAVLPFEIAPGPVPTPVTPPPPPPSMVLPPELQDALTGIETLAPDDFTARVADVIPLPDGNNFNVNEIQPNFGAGMTMGDILLTEPGELRLPEGVDTTLPDNTVDFGYGAVNVEDLAAIGVPGFGFDAETGEVTFDADQMIGAEGRGTAAAGRSYTPTFDNMYTIPEDDFTFGGGDTDGNIRDNRFIDTNNNGIDDRDENTGGSGTTTTGGSTTTGYGDWYNNLSDEQRAAFDAWMANNANNGVITTPFGTYNINQYTGGGSGTTTITPIESNFEFTAGTPAGSGQNVSVATEYALPGTVAPRAPADNPFVRPETQQGIGSLAGGG